MLRSHVFLCCWTLFLHAKYFVLSDNDQVLSLAKCQEEAGRHVYIVAVTESFLSISKDLIHLVQLKHSLELSSRISSSSTVITINTVNLSGSCVIALCSNIPRQVTSSVQVELPCEFFKLRYSDDTTLTYSSTLGSTSQSDVSSSLSGTQDLVTLLTASSSDAEPNTVELFSAFFRPNVNDPVLPPMITKSTLDLNDGEASISLVSFSYGFDNIAARKNDNSDSLENIYTFEARQYVYVLRNKYRVTPQRISPNKQWAIQLTRICKEDTTKELRSRLEIMLSCSSKSNSAGTVFPEVLSKPKKLTVSKDMADNEGLFAVKATLANDALYVYFVTRDNSVPTERAPGRICVFPIDELEKKFTQMVQKCKNTSSGAKIGVVARNKEMSLLVKDGVDCADIPSRSELGECNRLTKYWLLEDTNRQLEGQPFMYWQDMRKLREFVIKSSRPEMPKLEEGFALVEQPGLTFEIVKFSTSNKQIPKELDTVVVWKETLKQVHGVDNITASQWSLLDDSEQMFYVNSSGQVAFLWTNCAIYDTCDMLLATKKNFEYNCIWCLSEDGKSQKALEPEQCPTDATKLKHTCPPLITTVRPDVVSQELLIWGKNFRPNDAYNASICEDSLPCNILPTSSSSITDNILCQLQRLPEDTSVTGCDVLTIRTTVNDDNKPVQVTVRSQKPFTWKLNLDPSSSPGQAEPAPSASHSNAALIFAAVFIVACIILMLMCLVWRRRRNRIRKFMNNLDKNTKVINAQKNKRNAPPQPSRLPSNIPVDMTLPRFTPGHYEGGIPMEPMSANYEDLMSTIPDEVKIPLEQLELGKFIGEGQFGKVHKGIYKRGPDSITVAIKTIGASGSGRISSFVQEGLLMAEMDCPYVMKLIGISISHNQLYWTPMLVLPYMANGDLQSYLLNSGNSPSIREMLTYVLQIAHGMQYIHKMKLVHRDLAARNCMLDDNFVIRVADFGLTRDIYEDGAYLMDENARNALPFRSMAPESIERRWFNEKTDVVSIIIFQGDGTFRRQARYFWSFGVTCWEVFTRCKIPYGAMGSREVIQFIKGGFHLEQPNLLPTCIYEDVMVPCWHLNPDLRPTFAELCERIPRATQAAERVVPSNYLDSTYVNMLNNNSEGYERPNSEIARNDAIVTMRSISSSGFSDRSTAPLVPDYAYNRQGQSSPTSLTGLTEDIVTTV